MTTQETKPVANLTKKGYNQVCEYITGNTDPETAQVCLDLLKEALRNTLGFDPEKKASPDVFKKQNAQRKQNLEQEGVTHYEKYVKPKYERLKEQYPSVSARELLKNPLSVIQKMATM